MASTVEAEVFLCRLWNLPLQFQPGAEEDVAWGQAEHHWGHQATADGRNAFQKLHDLTGGEPGQQGDPNSRA